MIRVAMVCNKTARPVNPAIPIRVHYHFFTDALARYESRHKSVEFNIITHTGNRLDVAGISRDHDLVLMPWFDDMSQSMALKGIADYPIPIVAQCGDPRHVYMRPLLKFHEILKVDHYFDHTPAAEFYRYYPDNAKYTRIPYGVEPSLYETVRPWEERADDRIGISGAMNVSWFLYMYTRWLKRRPPELSGRHLYTLRTKCNALPYVIHTQSVYQNQSTDELPEALGAFRTAIAATTPHHTIKYMETPAAGCMTFMEATEMNQAATLGYEDGKTAVFINESNYQEKFQEYLDSPDDPKWRRIAEAGRKYTMENLTNDTAAEQLYQLMRRLLGEAGSEPDGESGGK